MTQLARLEALVEEAIPLLHPIQKHDTLWAAYYAAIEQIEAMLPESIPALPDLIRVARAAKLLLDASDILLAHPEEDLTIDDWLRFGASVNEVKPALAPLFAEVES